jgi:hypothetical protein
VVLGQEASAGEFFRQSPHLAFSSIGVQYEQSLQIVNVKSP